MKNIFKLILRYNFLIVLFIILLLPSFFLTIKMILGHSVTPLAFNPDYKLTNVKQTDENRPSFTLANLLNRDIQKYVEAELTQHIPLRSFFIRINNQIYYSLFKKSYSENGAVIIGKNNQLITEHYILTYCQLNHSLYDETTQLTLWADKLKKISDFYAAQGKTFIYLISPSKAEYMPENIPDRFHCNNRGISQHINQLIPLLIARKINYINGPALMVETREHYQTPMFDRGGIHWNALGATVAANHIINLINKHNLFYVNPIAFKYTVVNRAANIHSSDSISYYSRDLLNLLNVFHPDTKYTDTKLTFADNQKYTPINVVMIGGSFLEILLNIFQKNNVFKEMHYFNYFTVHEVSYQNGKYSFNAVNDAKVAFQQINLANVIILEENSELTVSNHGQLFFDTMMSYAKGTQRRIPDHA